MYDDFLMWQSSCTKANYGIENTDESGSFYLANGGG